MKIRPPGRTEADCGRTVEASGRAADADCDVEINRHGRLGRTDDDTFGDAFERGERMSAPVGPQLFHDDFGQAGVADGTALDGRGRLPAWTRSLPRSKTKRLAKIRWLDARRVCSANRR